jgi:hypothetical protein
MWIISIFAVNNLKAMRFLDRKIPPFMYRKSNLISLVAFTAFFALLFINLYQPFNSTDWYNISRFEYFMYSSLLILTGVMVVVISRIVMFFYTKRKTITYFQFAIWILFEILFMSLLYTFISYTLDESRNFWEVFNASAKNTSLVLLLPYSISTLFFAWDEKNRQVKELKELKENIANAEDETKIKKNNIVNFTDDKGEIKLSITKESLLYIESADNYLYIWYKGKMGVTKFLLRNTLKNIEEKFAGTTLIRTHRSFAVNFDQVKVAKKTKNGIFLDLGVDNVPEIPVSKSYGEKVTEWLLSSMS